MSKILLSCDHKGKSVMDKLLEIKIPLTSQYTEKKTYMSPKDKIKHQTQIIKERFGFTHGTSKKNKKRKK